MTVEEALKITETRAAGRTRYEGSEPYCDEVLAAEVRRLRAMLEWQPIETAPRTFDFHNPIDLWVEPPYGLQPYRIPDVYTHEKLLWMSSRGQYVISAAADLARAACNSPRATHWRRGGRRPRSATAPWWARTGPRA